MTFAKQPIELKDNPWIDLKGPQDSYMPFKTEQKDQSKWYYAFNDDICGISEIKALGEQEDGMYYNLDPQPWIGKWNVNDRKDLPKIVVLSLNPGIGKDDFNFIKREYGESDRQRGERYYKLMKECYTGEKNTFDVLFNPDFICYNSDYWIKRMWNLVCNVCGITPLRYKGIKTFENLILKDKKKIEKTFNKILFMDLFPYHSYNAKGLNIEVKDNVFTPQFKSMEFTKDIVKWLIKNKVTFIYARSQWLWEMYVEELKTYDKCFGLVNPQGTYFTEENCCTARCKYIKRNSNTTVFEKITKILTK